MRYLRLALLPLVFAACSDQTPVAPIADAPNLSASNGWEWWSVDMEFPTYFDCIAEEMLVEAHAGARYHSVTPPSHGGTLTRYRQIVWLLELFRATGTVSGDVWLPLPGYAAGQLWTNEGPEFSMAFENLRLENQTTGAVLRNQFRVHVVLNAQGEVKVDRIENVCTIKP